MSTKKKTRDLPARMEGVRRQFERWRETRKARSRVPDSLWTLAVKVARTYGKSRTARVLGVDYYALKKRVEREAAPDLGVLEKDPAATFIELAPSAPVGSCQCMLELENVGGAKMRICLTGGAALDLPALARSFWQGES